MLFNDPWPLQLFSKALGSQTILTRPAVGTILSQFIRTSATYNSGSVQVELHIGNVEETIEIVTEWEEKGQSGYIGTGFTKRGIYVCYFVHPYPLTMRSPLYETETTHEFHKG